MSQQDTWGPAEDALATSESRLIDELGRSLMHATPFISEGISDLKRALHPLERRGAQVHAPGTYALVRKYDDVTHNSHHYNPAGVLVHAKLASGESVRLADSYYTNATAGALDPVTGLPAPPYWRLKDSVTPFGGATYPHEELAYAPVGGGGPFLVRHNGLDSHGLYFAGGTKFQFNPGSVQFPSGRKIDDAIAPTDGQALVYNPSTTNWEPGVPSGAGAGAITPSAGAAAGTSPPAPLAAAATTKRGAVTFGTGTGASAGAVVQITFAVALAAAPVVALTPYNALTQALGLYVSGVSAAGFSVNCATAPANSQANTTYAFSFVTET